MSPDQEYENREALCGAIQQAIVLADARDNTLVGALLAQALDAAHCGGEAMSRNTAA